MGGLARMRAFGHGKVSGGCGRPRRATRRSLVDRHRGRSEGAARREPAMELGVIREVRRKQLEALQAKRDKPARVVSARLRELDG
jgi:hypothetical protein